MHTRSRLEEFELQLKQGTKRKRPAEPYSLAGQSKRWTIENKRQRVNEEHEESKRMIVREETEGEEITRRQLAKLKR